MGRVAAALLVLALAGPAGDRDDLRASRKTFLAARAAVADGRFQEALALYRAVLQKTPSDPIVHLEYAQLLRDLNVLDQAASEAREAVRLDPNLAEARRLLGTLDLAAAEKDPARLSSAIEQLSAARRLAPTDMTTAVSLARALLAANRPSEAATVLDELPELQGQPAVQRLAADAKAKSGHWNEAEAIYRALHEADPADREITAALIEACEEQDQLDDALALLKELRSRDPENAAIDERIVLDLARAGKFADAEQRARELSAKRPEDRAGKRLLATVLFERGSVAEGEKILRDLIDADPDDPGTRRALASEMTRERRFKDARAQLEEIVNRSGNDPRRAEARSGAAVEMGFVSYLEKNWAESRRLLAPEALRDGKVQTRAARILLAADREAEDFADGLARAKSFAAAEPLESEWQAETGEFLIRSGDEKAGMAKLTELTRSGELEKMMAVADVYARLKRYDAAAKVAREASSKFPESTDALFRLGSSLERGGSSAEAEKVFLRLLEMRPNDAASQNYLGYMWADKGVQLDRARDLLEKAVGREPRNPAYLDSLGWVYFRMGRIEDAQRTLREAYRREPTDPTIEEHMGDLDLKLGNVDSAIRHWEKALELKHDEPDRVRQKLQRARSHESRR